MARRRKKTKAAAQAKAREKDASPMITDKSLPALPPHVIPPNAFSNDRVDPESDTPTELSPRPRAQYTQADSSSRSSSRPARSPERTPAESIPKDGGLTLPKPSYRNNRNSSVMVPSGDAIPGDGESFFIPIAVDPSPIPTSTPRSTSDTLSDPPKKSLDKEYFSISRSGSEKKGDAQAAPHIAFQEKGRQPSSDYDSPQPLKPPMRKLSKSSRQQEQAVLSPNGEEPRPRKTSKSTPEEFKLQDAPKSKKLISSRSPSQSSNFGAGPLTGTNGSPRKERDPIPIMPPAENSALLGAADRSGTPRNSIDSRKPQDDDMQSQSDTASPSRQDPYQSRPILRKEVASSSSRNGESRRTSSRVLVH